VNKNMISVINPIVPKTLLWDVPSLLENIVIKNCFILSIKLNLQPVFTYFLPFVS
jgi:hypothetical protein